MICPFLETFRSECRAVDGDPSPLPRSTIAAYCRGGHAACPAFRFVRVTGRPANAADFHAWVLRGIPPGRTDPPRDVTSSDGT